MLLVPLKLQLTGVKSMDLGSELKAIGLIPMLLETDPWAYSQKPGL
jgi:hypothetical protein